MYRLCVFVSGQPFKASSPRGLASVLMCGIKLSKQSKGVLTVLKNNKPLAVIRRGKIIAIHDKDEMASGIMKAKGITNELLLEVLNFYL